MPVQPGQANESYCYEEVRVKAVRKLVHEGYPVKEARTGYKQDPLAEGVG